MKKYTLMLYLEKNIKDALYIITFQTEEAFIADVN